MNAARLLLAVSLCLVAAGCDQQSGAKDAPVRPVLSQVVEAGRASAPRFVGVVAAQVSVAQSFNAGGTLATRNVALGSQVRAGDVVATLDAATAELALRDAWANVASAQAQFANAADSEARLRALNQQDFATAANLEQAEQQTAAARAALAQARARLAQAEEQVSYTTLAAPFDGIVTAVGAEPGEVVAAGQMMVTVADPNTRDVVIDVPEPVVADISVGTAFVLSPQLSPQVKAKGQVREIAPQADPRTRSWRVKIGIAEKIEQFWLGSTATATLADAGTETLTIPLGAVRDAGGRPGVWIVDEKAGMVRARPIMLGQQDGDRVTVLSGIEAGERIVIAGVNGLADGQKIRIEESRR